MKIKITHFAFALITCFFSFTLLAAAQPQWHVENPLQNIEVSSVEQEITREVTFSNNGTEPLHIEVEKTSCGCTGAILSTNSLAPGKSGVLVIKMKVSGWGVKTETVTLLTNDPRNLHPVITVKAKLPATVLANPLHIIAHTHEGEPTLRFLSLLLPNEATVTKISNDSPYIQAKKLGSQTIESGTLQQVEVSFTDAAPPGILTDELVIHLENAPTPQITVPIECLVTPDVSVEPSQIFLGKAPQDATIRKIAVVQSYGKYPFSIKEIKGSRIGVNGKADSNIVSTAHAVEIIVVASGEVNSFLQDTIKLTLSNGYIIELPVVGVVVEKTPVVEEKQNTRLGVGLLAPEFTAIDSNGNPHDISEMKSKKNLLLTFFPKCFTGGCAGHLASLQRELANFTNADTEIWAVSVDPSSEQVAFAAKLGLQFPLLPDTERTLSILYGAAQNKSDMAARQSILIDKQGIVRWVDTDVHIQTNGADMLAKIKELGMAN